MTGAQSRAGKKLLIRGPADIEKHFDVSRESVERLKIYEELLVKWQKVQNLVSPTTLDEIWHRHFADSAQLLPYVGSAKTIVDLGSGGGFPALVLAILLAERGETTLHLVEANGRKCGFLREVVRQTGLSSLRDCGFIVEIHNARIEEFADSRQDFKADLILARALAPLSSLLALAQPFFSKTSRALFLKGREFEAEVKDALRTHSFQVQVHDSLTDLSGRVIEISQLGLSQEEIRG